MFHTDSVVVSDPLFCNVTGKREEGEKLTGGVALGVDLRIESEMEGRPASILSKYDEAMPEEVHDQENLETSKKKKKLFLCFGFIFDFFFRY